MTRYSPRRVEYVFLALILVLATGLRLWRLGSVPPGWTHDEAGHVHDSRAIQGGARPVYQAVGYGREPLYDYLGAVAMTLAEGSSLALRGLSAVAGVLTLLITYLWARQAFGAELALWAVAFQAASFWSLATARQALRSSLLPPLWMAAVYCYWRLFERRLTDHLTNQAWGWMAGAALSLGAALYTYFPARLLWVAFFLFLGYLAVWKRSVAHLLVLPTLLTVLGAGALALPMFVYLWRHPGVEQRLAMLSAPLEALLAGDATLLWKSAVGHLAGLVLPGAGDRFLAYNIPGRPVFDPLTAVLAAAGLVLCVARWRDPACAFLVLWLLVGSAPSLVTGATASTTRSIAALPAWFMLPALALTIGVQWIGRHCRRWLAWVARLGGVALVVYGGALAIHDYFIVWGEAPDVRAAYQYTLVEAARYVRELTGGVVAFSSIYPQAPHDPYVFEASCVRCAFSTRWFDGRRALLLPAESKLRLVVLSSASLDPYFVDWPGLVLQERVWLRPDDLDPYFEIYDWRPAQTLHALYERLSVQLPEGTLPLRFGDSLLLIGYEQRARRVVPGDVVELVTAWRVLRTPVFQSDSLATLRDERVIFVHLLDKDAHIIGQEDRLDAPSWDWQAGDTVVQLHRFTVHPNARSGEASLEIGVYQYGALERLPVQDATRVIGDHVILGIIEVVTE